MVSLGTLGVATLAVWLVAVAVARLRRHEPSRCVADAIWTFAVATLTVSLAAVAYGLGRDWNAHGWRDVGSLLLWAAPVPCAACARWLRQLPFWRSLVAGLVAIAAVALWQLLYLKGPGAWTLGEAIAAALLAAAFCSGAVCAAAWTRRGQA